MGRCPHRGHPRSSSEGRGFGLLVGSRPGASRALPRTAVNSALPTPSSSPPGCTPRSTPPNRTTNSTAPSRGASSPAKWHRTVPTCSSPQRGGRARLGHGPDPYPRFDEFVALVAETDGDDPTLDEGGAPEGAFGVSGIANDDQQLLQLDRRRYGSGNVWRRRAGVARSGGGRAGGRAAGCARPQAAFADPSRPRACGTSRRPVVRSGCRGTPP